MRALTPRLAFLRGMSAAIGQLECVPKSSFTTASAQVRRVHGRVLKTARGRELPRGFESHTLRTVISRDIGMTPDLRLGFGVAGFPGAAWCSGRCRERDH